MDSSTSGNGPSTPPEQPLCDVDDDKSVEEPFEIIDSQSDVEETIIEVDEILSDTGEVGPDQVSDTGEASPDIVEVENKNVNVPKTPTTTPPPEKTDTSDTDSQRSNYKYPPLSERTGRNAHRPFSKRSTPYAMPANTKTVRTFLHEPGIEELKKELGQLKARPTSDSEEDVKLISSDYFDEKQNDKMKTMIRREALVNPTAFMQRCNEMIVKGDAMGGEIPDDELQANINEALLLESELDALIEKKKNLKENLKKMCNEESNFIRSIHADMPPYMQGVLRIDGDTITINEAAPQQTPAQQPQFNMFPSVPSLISNGVTDSQPPVQINTINTMIPPPMFVPPPQILEKPPVAPTTASMDTNIPSSDSGKAQVTETIFTIRAGPPPPSMMMQPPPAQPFNPTQQPPPAQPQPTLNLTTPAPMPGLDGPVPLMGLNRPPPFVPGVPSFPQPTSLGDNKSVDDKDKMTNIYQSDTPGQLNQFTPNNDLSRTITSLITHALKKPASPSNLGQSPAKDSSSLLGAAAGSASGQPRNNPPSLIQLSLPPPANLQRSNPLNSAKKNRKNGGKKKFGTAGQALTPKTPQSAESSSPQEQSSQSA